MLNWTQSAPPGGALGKLVRGMSPWDVFEKTLRLTDPALVEDWDIQRLHTGEAITGLPGREPFRFRLLRAK